MSLSRILAASLAAIFALIGSGAWAGSDPCCPPCEPCYQEVIKKHCVPSTEVVKKTKAVYDCRSEDVCLPKCSLFKKKGCCDDCCEGNCGKPRVKRVLIKKFETTEECRTKCTVECTSELVPMKARKCKQDCQADCTTEIHVPGEVIAPPVAMPAPAK